MANTPMKRMVQKFIIIEFLSNRLNSQSEVNEMVGLIEEKLVMSSMEAKMFLRDSIGLCRRKKF